MEFNWNKGNGLTAEKWNDVRNNPGYHDYIGNVRVGDLCFDIRIEDTDNYGVDEPIIVYDLFVGGVDDGYGYSSLEATNSGEYSNKNDVPIDKLYPYTCGDGGAFGKTEDLFRYDYDEFVRVAEKELTDFIMENGSFRYGDKTMLEKAEEPLHVW